MPRARAITKAVGRRATWLAAAALALAGCAVGRGAVEYVWVHDRPEPPAGDAAYVIAPGDILAVRVQGQESMSGKARVRDDGRISLPFLNDVQAADLTPLELAARVQVRLKEFVVKPVVMVSLEESRPLEVAVVGEVRKAGSYPLGPRGGVLQALAAAGGIGEFADRDRIFVLRKEERIRFTYRALTGAEPRAAAFRLRAGDVVVVE